MNKTLSTDINGLPVETTSVPIDVGNILQQIQSLNIEIAGLNDRKSKLQATIDAIKQLPNLDKGVLDTIPVDAQLSK